MAGSSPEVAGLTSVFFSGMKRREWKCDETERRVSMAAMLDGASLVLGRSAADLVAVEEEGACSL